ncbi:uncharacterized protein LOC128228673 [Mya arenaria]|uniref:uncharacterized protein LOC128228673 n=1 Tax=Mya arenaria TaxID=6604 RepID=UPI0022E5F186|nr:uncharacterized protein LOC128228673 [Mya arenaria]
MSVNTCTSISGSKIPENATIVFDWDNTLKMYNKQTRSISSRVEKSFLEKLKNEMNCRMYIISAISPSRINLDTILFEVGKLGLLDIFVDLKDTPEIVRGKYARKGRVIICGYDKAETFLELSGYGRELGGTERDDEVATVEDDAFSDLECDGVEDEADFVDMVVNKDQHGLSASSEPRGGSVLFFDDEEVNITNFSSLVPGSICYLVK